MDSDIVLPKDEKVLEILSEYRVLFCLTGHTDEALLYERLHEKMKRQTPIDVDTLLFVARVTSNKILNKPKLVCDLLKCSSSDELLTEAKQVVENYHFNATYLIGFIVTYTNILNVQA